MSLDADQAPPRTEPAQIDTRLRWQDHVNAAITDLRNSDRSPTEQRVYDILRLMADGYTK